MRAQRRRRLVRRATVSNGSYTNVKQSDDERRLGRRPSTLGNALSLLVDYDLAVFLSEVPLLRLREDVENQL
jgi:hypothetical protein